MERIITARYRGIAADGSTIRKGDEVVYCGRTRKVLTASPLKVSEFRKNQRPGDYIDLDTMWEDQCARDCGLI